MLGTRQLKKIFSGVVQKPPPAVTLPIASNKLSTPWNCTTQKILLLVNSYFTLSRSLEKAGLFCVFHQSQQGIKLESFASWETWPHWWTPSGVLWADFKTLLNYHALKKLSRRSADPIILLLTISRSKWDSSLIEISSIFVVEKHPICECTFSSRRFSNVTL